MADVREALAASETHFRFLAELGEATRSLNDPERVLAIVAQRLGEQLRASRCAYAEVEQDGETFTIRHDYVDGCASSTGTYRLSLFGPLARAAQREGRTLVVRDVERELSPEQGASMFSAIDVRAIVCCPLLRKGRLAAMMAVHQTVARDWSVDEIALVESVVERSWSYIERARSVRDLAESEARMRQLADAMPQIVWTARPDGVLDYYNRRWFEYIDVPESDRERATWDSHIHPEDLPRVYETWGRALASGEEYVTEFRVRRADGQYRWFLVRALPVRDERQQIARWVGTCTDIHDKKRADEALNHSRAQMELIVEGAEVGVWYCPLPFDRLEWNARVKEHFHLPSDAVVDIELFYQRIHPDDRERTRAAIEASIAEKRRYDIDYRTVSADGQRIKWVRAIGYAVYDGAGNPQRFDGITIDVTKRMEAEVALRESEERFRTMSDSAPVMIWVTRPDGYCEYLNRRWYEFTGQSLEEAAGLGWLSAVHADDAARSAESFLRANAERTPFSIEYRLRRRDGTYRWCVDAATPRLGANGEFLGFIGSVIDITDRALAEQERSALFERERAARIEAERASRMKDEFLATLSHELRTPLNAILGWAHLLKRGGSRAGELERGIAVIERNARAQAQIIEDLLDMSRIISGKVRLEVRLVDLRAVVQSALETAKPGADAKGITLSAELPPTSELALYGDPDRLHQVLWNLLSNALKFTPRGGRVKVVAEARDGLIELRVSDSGEGIAPEFLPFVFDRFRQADATTTRRHGGLGLGLSIVKQLVELHGGTVSVRSEGRGHGSAFSVALPLRAPHSDSAETKGPEAAESSVEHDELDISSIDLDGLRVLVVDDEADARGLIERVLTGQGAQVATARSVAEARGLLAARSYDLLVSDIGMPDEDGYSLIAQLRAANGGTNRHIPAIALTAYARSEDRVRALRAGYHMHLVKPIAPAELVASVARLARATAIPS